MEQKSIFQATISDLQEALSSGALTSVNLVARYLRRINAYDQRGPGLNAIPVLNKDVFEEAAASDDRRAAGEHVGLLEGIPYTVKDSFKVKGMTVAAGSAAFQHLTANEDAHTVDTIRKAGGVLIGRTNMPPMAEGGMQPGVYGRAESPYNPDYLSAAYGSGSSNGGGVAVAASFSAFGLGEETYSSGRSPASNNGLVAYTPSRGVISIRGNWPLYPTHDVVVPFTTNMDDMLTLLETIGQEDTETAGDFWREQPFVELPKLHIGRDDNLTNVKNSVSLEGLRIAVPESYFGKPQPGSSEIAVTPAILELWEEARKDLEALGAEIVMVPDLPVVSGYESPSLQPDTTAELPEYLDLGLIRAVMAHGWDRFLRLNQDPKIPDLSAVDENSIWPCEIRTPTEKRWDQKESLGTGNYVGFHEIVKGTSMFELPTLDKALQSLETHRKTLLHDWLNANKCDFALVPAAGDVGAADADVNDESYAYCRKNGIWFSSGNAAFRHLGVPTVSVTMGVIPDKEMPISLTFIGRAYEDVELLELANAYEKKSRKRVAPRWTPELETDKFEVNTPGTTRAPRPKLVVSSYSATPIHDPSMHRVEVKGVVEASSAYEMDHAPIVEITVDGHDLDAEHLTLTKVNDCDPGAQVYNFHGWVEVPKPIARDVRFQTMAPVDRDKTMVVVLARSDRDGYPSGWLGMI